METKYEDFYKAVMYEVKLMTLVLTASRSEPMTPPLRPNRTFDPIAFKKLFFDFAKKEDIIEEDRLRDLLQRIYKIFGIPESQRTIVI